MNFIKMNNYWFVVIVVLICIITITLIFAISFVLGNRKSQNVNAELSNTGVKVIARIGNGVLLDNSGQKVLLLQGSPYDMGYQHGRLIKKDVRKIVSIVLKACNKLEPGKLAQIWAAAESFIPERYKEELRGLADGAGLKLKDVQLANVFPELFHCSGIAVFGDATTDGQLLHCRVLDYETSVGLQEHSVVIIARPDNYNEYINATIAGIIGSVTGMNREQITIGEMGGGGVGNWKGIPMIFLVRMALEETNTLEKAIRIFFDNPRTCEYYYVLSDAKIPYARALKCVPERVDIIDPNLWHPLMPVPMLKDALMVSGEDRINYLRQNILKYYGKIDKDAMIDIIKRPVSMETNFHNAIFSPSDLKMWLAVAVDPKKTDDYQACYQTYYEYDMMELLKFAAIK